MRVSVQAECRSGGNSPLAAIENVRIVVFTKLGLDGNKRSKAVRRSRRFNLRHVLQLRSHTEGEVLIRRLDAMPVGRRQHSEAG